MKNKTAGGKVLRTKTRSAAQEEVSQSTSNRILEHQRELFEARQRDGVAKYSEEGDGTGKNEGKQWKRFNSYKGEAALPPEVETLRVRFSSLLWTIGTDILIRLSLIAKL